MDTFSLKNGFHKDLSLSELSTDADGSENLYYLDNSEISESTPINQSMIISGNVNNIIHGIHDISNYTITSDELNTNIDALMPEQLQQFLEGDNVVHVLTGNVEPLNSHCKPEHTLLNTSNKSDFDNSKVSNTVEIPEVDIICEESNGKFRVHIHIKGLKKG